MDAADQAPTEGTPEDASTPESGTGHAEEVNWQERAQQIQSRYDHLQPEFTRVTQRLSQYEKDPEFRAQLLRELAEEQGYVLPDVSEEYAEHQSQSFDPRVDEVLEWKAQQEEERIYNQYRQKADAELRQMGVPEGEFLELAANAAYQHSLETNEPVDLKAAADAIQALLDRAAEHPRVRDQVLRSNAKTKPRAGLTSATGREATQAPDLDNREQRQAWMLEQLADQ